MIKINSANLPVSPTEMSVTILDIDNNETSVRTADGTLNRDRIAVKRQLQLSFPIMTSAKMKTLLSLMTSEFFNVEFMDPLEGELITKEMYVGNRDPAVGFIRGGVYYWKELKITLTER